LDREKLKLYIAPVKAAEAFLKQQPPIQRPVRKTQPGLFAMSTNALQQVEHPDAAMDRRIAAHHAVIEEMRRWLDKFLKN
jgi:hypothetical protein